MCHKGSRKCLWHQGSSSCLCYQGRRCLCHQGSRRCLCHQGAQTQQEVSLSQSLSLMTVTHCGGCSKESGKCHIQLWNHARSSPSFTLVHNGSLKFTFWTCTRGSYKTDTAARFHIAQFSTQCTDYAQSTLPLTKSTPTHIPRHWLHFQSHTDHTSLIVSAKDETQEHSDFGHHSHRSVPLLCLYVVKQEVQGMACPLWQPPWCSSYLSDCGWEVGPTFQSLL